jgi:hypothetical protein
VEIAEAGDLLKILKHSKEGYAVCRLSSLCTHEIFENEVGAECGTENKNTLLVIVLLVFYPIFVRIKKYINTRKCMENFIYKKLGFSFLSKQNVCLYRKSYFLLT